MKKEELTVRPPHGIARAAFVIVFLFSLAIAWFIQYLVRENENQHIYYEAQAFSNEITETMTSQLSKNRVMESYLVQTGGEINDFSEIANRLLTGEGLRAVMFAPQGVVMDVFPPQEATDVLGTNLIAENPSAQSAILARRQFYLGPYTLEDDSLVIIGCLPVYLPNEQGQETYWGIAAIALNFPEILDGVTIAQLEAQKIGCRVWKPSADTGEPQVLLETRDGILKRNVSIEFSMFGSSWNISMCSLKKWYEKPSLWLSIVMAFVLSFLAAFAAHTAEHNRFLNSQEMMRQEQEKHNKQMKELQAKEDVYKNAANTDASAYFECNLTKDEITGELYDYRNSKSGIPAPVEIPGLGKPVRYTVLRDWWIQNKLHSNTKDTEVFTRMTDRDYLIACAEKGEEMVQEFVYWVSRSDGRHCMRQLYFLSKSETNSEITALCILYDITEQELSRQRLELQTAAINGMAEDFEAMLYIDTDTDKFEVIRVFGDDLEKNRKYVDSDIGFSALLRKTMESHVHPEDLERVLAHLEYDSMRRELQEKKVLYVNYRVMNEMGGVLYYQAKVVAAPDTDHRCVILGVHNVDEVTRRDLTQSETIKRNFEIIEILTSEYTSVFYVDLTTQRVASYRMDSDAQKLFGQQKIQWEITYESLLERYTREFVQPQSREELLEAGAAAQIRKALTDRKSININYLSSKGHYCEARFVKVGDGKPSAVALGFADRDTEIRNEQQRQKQLEEARTRAESANEAKSRFLFNMSHDIRTPMSVILGFTEMAQKHLDDKERVRDCLGKVMTSGKHLRSLINDILDMSRIENGKVTIERSPVNIRLSSERFMEIMQPSAAEKQIELTEECNITHETIMADEVRVDRVIMNILSNAIKYTHQMGKVHYSIIETPSDKAGYAGYDMIVSDNGIGMSPEFVEKIYESFSREKNSTTSGVEGTGLGMAITKQLVDMMGGTIHIDSKVNEGTTVTVHFDFELTELEGVNTQNAPNDEEPDFTGKRILLVEDNALNREIVLDFLSDWNLEADEAEDGICAVRILTDAAVGYYQAILMDIQMPKMNGYEATQIIRKFGDAKKAGIPIIAMTANAFEEDKQKALAVGMNAHIAKPVDATQLLATLTQFL